MPCPQSNEHVTYFCGSDVRCDYVHYELRDYSILDCPHSPCSSSGSNVDVDTMSNVTRGANRAASIITGNCQSRKTKTTIDELVSLFKADVGSEDSALLLVITQSNSSQNAYQMHGRMESHVELSQIFPTFLGMDRNIRKSALQPPTSKAARCAMVRYFHKANIAAMMDVATSRHWDHLYLVVDEADMGNDEGVLKRLSAIHSLDCALATSDVFATVASGMFVDAARPALRVIFVTATPINLSKTFHDIGTKHLNTFPEGSLVRNILEKGIAVDHTWVTPHESYVSLEWFKEQDLVHIIADPVKPKVSKSADHVGQDPTEPEEPDLISLRTDAAFDVMRTLSKERQRLMMVSISSKRDDHTQLAERLIHEDISDLVVCLNSQNGKNYMVHTHHNAWAIPNKQLADAADRGAFRLYMNDMGQMHDTGIESCHDIPLSHILLCATTRPCDLPALLSSIEDPTTRYQIRTLSQWFMTNKSNGSNANRNPHMPTKGLMRVALVGGNLLNRGITIQDARVGFVCTSFVFMDGPTRADGGASHTQKVGRALGNLLPVFQEFKPLLLISAGMYESALANERLTRRHGMRTHGTSIQIGDYIPHEEFVRERKEIRASHTQAAVKTVGTEVTKTTEEKPKERSKRTALRGAARVAFTLRPAHDAESLLLLTEPLSPELTAVLPMMPVLPSDPANKAQRGAMQTAYRAKVLAALKKRGLTFPNIQVTWGNRVAEFDSAAYINCPNYETCLVVGAIDGKMHAMRMHRVNVQAFRHKLAKTAAMYTLDGRMHVLEKTGV